MKKLNPGKWTEEIDIRDFIQLNYTPYEGDSHFLSGPTTRTTNLWESLADLFKKERELGVLSVSQIPSGVSAHAPGYIDKENELIVGLQTEEPLRRAIMPNGGWRMVELSLKSYGIEPDEKVAEVFTKYRKTHNEGVFDAYTSDILKCRKSGIITGLPDAYGRGRIIGDYRRVALYGVDKLIEEKLKDRKETEKLASVEEVIRDREEISEQIKALKELKEMAYNYGYDISFPAKNAREAIQWTYFAYLGAIKQQNGAAMSVGRVSTFFDIYIEKDIQNNELTEEQAQELIDDFVIKLRLVRFLRTPEYNELFSGDPIWATESIGGMGEDGRTLVTKTSFRILNTLRNLGPSPEPNLTVLWSVLLPEGFKKFCAEISLETSSVQYESDDLIRKNWGDDSAIACCVSPMAVGKQMQFFGARVNLAKTFLYSINGGRDEISGEQIGPKMNPCEPNVQLKYEDILDRLDIYMDWLARTYVNALNIIHYMHDKYCYESLEMALHDKEVLRTMACGIAGLSHAADSLSAIKYAKVYPIVNENGLIVDFKTEGEFPHYGNNIEEVDNIAVMLVEKMMNYIKKNPTYRNAIHTQSVLTITSNVVYGKKTGNMPDGRRKGEPFAPGANPSNQKDKKGALATLMSVAKLPYESAQDGISLTLSYVPQALGHTKNEQIDNLYHSMDGYFGSEGYHINVNVLNRSQLMDAMENPEKYPQLTIRVSGYAVNFIKLTREQQMDVINRTFHDFL